MRSAASWITWRELSKTERNSSSVDTIVFDRRRIKSLSTKIETSIAPSYAQNLIRSLALSKLRLLFGKLSPRFWCLNTRHLTLPGERASTRPSQLQSRSLLRSCSALRAGSRRSEGVEKQETKPRPVALPLWQRHRSLQGRAYRCPRA